MKTITVYKFNELPEDMQEKLVEKNRYFNTEYDDWYEFILDDAKTTAEIFGLEIKNIYFSCGYCQSDYCAIEGYYSYKKQSVQKILEYTPKDTELQEIVKGLLKAQKQNFYSVYADIYTGRNTSSFEVNSEYNCKDITMVQYWIEQYIGWIHTRLYKEIEYLTSDESIRESLISNDCNYTKEGVQV